MSTGGRKQPPNSISLSRLRSLIDRRNLRVHIRHILLEARLLIALHCAKIKRPDYIDLASIFNVFGSLIQALESTK
tara:strand:- start:176 stop:403 length:228 start_codon:yes stop_codon:yes gene_type:complete